jgi:hypothetical protein
MTDQILSTLGGPDRDFTAFEAWAYDTTYPLTRCEVLTIYVDECQEDVVGVLEGAGTAPDYYRLIRVVGDMSRVKIDIREKYSRVVSALYDVFLAAFSRDHATDGREWIRPYDVVAVLPHDPNLDSDEEQKLFLIRTVEMTEQEADALTTPLYEGNLSKAEYLSIVEAGGEKPKQLKLCRYAMDKDTVSQGLTFDEVLMLDPSVKYQPFKKSAPLSTADAKALFKDKVSGKFKFAKAAE